MTSRDDTSVRVRGGGVKKRGRGRGERAMRGGGISTSKLFHCSNESCGRVFNSRDAAKGHMSSHAQAAFWCRFCRVPVGYRFEKGLRDHTKRVHGGS